MEPADLAFRAGPWIRTPGPDADVVLSTRIRLARNVEGYPFPQRISPEKRRELETRLRGWIRLAEVGDAPQYCNLQSIPEVTKQVLMERHLISRELARGDGDRGVTFARTELISIMTNEEDHLRIQVLHSGLALEKTFGVAEAVDERLEAHVPYAFHERYGFLTACPTNTGTGLRVSVMMHLPALVIAEQMEKVFQSAAKVGLTVRGFYGEGTKAAGDVIQISNQHTLGQSEGEILGTMARMVPKIVEYERGVRAHLVKENRIVLEDKIWRSLGMLRYARRLTTEETMDLLSAVRLGVQMQLIPGLKMGDVNELFILTQPGHLQAMKGSELAPNDRDVFRANLLRERFKPEAN